MSTNSRYTTAIQRLTVIAARIDYNRLYNNLAESKYNRLITATYKAIDQLHDLLKYSL